MTEIDDDNTGRQEHRDDRLPKSSPSGKQGFVSQRPHYLDLEEARQLLAEMNIHLTQRQIKRSSDIDAKGKRKLPWFIDPIEGRLKIERNALLSAYFNRQVEAERNCELYSRGEVFQEHPARKGLHENDKRHSS
ncbi:MAG TPA: hypothetical protein VIE66_12265 [Methylocella sp.]